MWILFISKLCWKALFHEYMKVELLNKNYWDIYCREIFINMKFHRIPTNKQTGQIFLLSSLT